MRQQYKITLGDELRARLNAASERSGRPVSEEIRARLEQSLEGEVFDKPTLDFAAAVLDVAREVEIETEAPWHADAGAYRTLQRAIRMVLAKWRPAGVPDDTWEEVKLAPYQERPHASHPTNDTNALGVWIAHDVLETPDRNDRARIRAAREQALKEIVKLEQNREEDSND
jgi:predicted DNA-binding protein